jgi:MSHA biogenesis protein MshQ
MDVRRLHYTPAICIALRRLNDPNKGRVMGLLRTILAKIPLPVFNQPQRLLQFWTYTADTRGSIGALMPFTPSGPTRRARAQRFKTLAAVLVLAGAWMTRPAMAQQALFVGSSIPALNSTAVNSITLTAPTGVAAGELMIAYVAQNYSYLSINQAPSGWTNYQDSFITTIGMAVFTKVATASDVGGVTTYTWTFNESGVTAGAILAFGGLTTGYQIAAANIQGNAASTSRTAPSVTPGSPDTMLVTLYAVANGTADAQSSPSGLTQAFDQSTQGGTKGILLSAFYGLITASTATGTLVSNSASSVSAPNIGATLALIPLVGTTMAQWHFDESAWTGTSGQVLDSSGNGYNATAEHGATTALTSPAIAGTTAGTCGYGTVNGSTQYVQMPSSMPHVGNTFTVTAWIRPTSFTNGRIWIDDENYNGYAMSFGDLSPGVMRFFSRSPSLTILDAYTTLSLNQWYFVAIVMDAVTNQTMYLYIFNSSGSLINLNSTSKSSFSPGTGANAAVGGNADGAVEGAILRFQGNIDEVTVYPIALNYNDVVAAQTLTHSCGIGSSVPDHYSVSTPGTAVNCQAAAVTVTALSSTQAILATTDTIALSTSTGHGDWTLTSGSGTFVAGSSNSGAASYTYATSDAGVAVFALRDTYAETVTINVVDGSASATSGTALASGDLPLTFVASGFIVTNGSNVVTTIGTQQSGVTSTQSLALQAVRTDTKTGACTSTFASGTTANIGLAYQCNNPTACVSGQTFTIANNGTSTNIASNPNSGISNYTTVPLKFSTPNAEAPITLRYSDAGQLTLVEKYAIPLGSGASSANSMTGASQFVVKPYTLSLSNISRTKDGFANPGASTATGTVFIGAGQPFIAAVTARNYQGAATPNFGQETSPASVTLTSALVLPTGGDNPAISGGFGAYSAGSATGASFSWPEVGSVTLTPGVTNYLGSGALTGTSSGTVGRFVPNNFATALNTPIFATACSAGSFTYVGQPFTYSVAPVITVTAQALGGTTTQNYSGALFRLTNASLTGRAYTPTPASAALTLTGLPATTADPAIVSLGSGQGSLTFSAGTGIAFARSTPTAPFNANIALSMNVIDLDGVAATSNPVTFGVGTGILFTASAAQWYGRLALRNALGSELLDLPMSLTTQYYLSTAQGFTSNTSDSCTTAPTIAFGNYQQNLNAGETCVRDSGSPGISGVGCAAAASNRYTSPASVGAFNLILAAPGSGNNGAADVTATAPSWLQYPWNAASGNTSPTGIAAFGEFPGPASRTYQREVY